MKIIPLPFDEFIDVSFCTWYDIFNGFIDQQAQIAGGAVAVRAITGT